jgi:hypothetical protein|tara:strand:- start:3674 stop:3799 length:126 start_codon:yes stop_codon:yes gene_type:complete
MDRNESILETLGALLVIIVPFWLIFTYSGRDVIAAFINFIK